MPSEPIERAFLVRQEHVAETRRREQEATEAAERRGRQIAAKFVPGILPEIERLIAREISDGRDSVGLDITSRSMPSNCEFYEPPPVLPKSAWIRLGIALGLVDDMIVQADVPTGVHYVCRHDPSGARSPHIFVRCPAGSCEYVAEAVVPFLEGLDSRIRVITPSHTDLDYYIISWRN